ncbi:Uu.00g053130.m01.CDS01 [Anthostomella pinea]|uniref:Uu.00g053130.m01.CDS01 n=1 Tax=Anthostomella pinea TaxID=933095 RepID=A0AAI8VXK7_9PEZI|nr:Uu.00g053130.m01.CDS01 [Anthostomella pinea]
MHFRCASVISVLPLVSIAIAADTAAWKARNIYFALTDRVARSSGDDGGKACSSLGNYCGGTFQGLESKLEYIQGMGFDAIWITPVVANKQGGYHGYWAEDLYSINKNYGTADDLKSLVSAAHAKGIYVMADVVANHMGPGDISSNKPSPLNQQSSYHSQEALCHTGINYANQTSVQVCSLSGLPDVKTEDETIRTLYQKWISWLVSEYGFDGLRIDTVREVEKDFWPPFVAAAGVYAIGEVWDGDAEYLSGYADVVPGLLNYAIYYPMNRFYQQTGSSQELVDMFNEITDKFDDPAALGNFVDNHDNARFLSEKDDTALLKNALAYVILARGIPIVYYGTEQGYSGASDPANREDLWRSSFNTDADLYQAISRLLDAKKAVGGLGGDDHDHLYVEDTAYAWSRALGNLIVLTTNSGSKSSTQYCFNSQQPNKSWKDSFGSGSSYTADGNGKVCVNVTNGEPVVLVAS